MRVLMFSWEYPPHVVGGLGKHVMELTPALVRQGVTVHLVTPAWNGGEPREAVDGITVHRVPPAPAGDNIHDTAWRTNRELQRYVERLWPEVGGFDVIHAHDWLVAFAACELRNVFRSPLVVTMHATERGRGGGHLLGDMAGAIHSTEQWLVGEAQRVIVTSEYMAGQVRGEFGVAADRVHVVPNGVDTARFDRYEGVDLSSFRRSYASPEEKIVFSIGRVEYVKGWHVLLEAVPRVLACCPQTRFVVAGNGGELEHLRCRAGALGIASQVSFTGSISDEERDRLYRVADAAVFPSLYEPFGIVALEAMAARCPVVVSAVGGLQEVVRCYETGITVYPGDADSLAWGILQVLTQPERAQAWAAAAYRLVREQYHWDRLAALTVAVYERAQRDWTT